MGASTRLDGACVASSAARQSALSVRSCAARPTYLPPLATGAFGTPSRVAPARSPNQPFSAGLSTTHAPSLATNPKLFSGMPPPTALAPLTVVFSIRRSCSTLSYPPPSPAATPRQVINARTAPIGDVRRPSAPPALRTRSRDRAEGIVTSSDAGASKASIEPPVDLRYDSTDLIGHPRRLSPSRRRPSSGECGTRAEGTWKESARAPWIELHAEMAITRALGQRLTQPPSPLQSERYASLNGSLNQSLTTSSPARQPHPTPRALAHASSGRPRRRALASVFSTSTVFKGHPGLGHMPLPSSSRPPPSESSAARRHGPARWGRVVILTRSLRLMMRQSPSHLGW